jgi:hypothetical protein
MNNRLAGMPDKVASNISYHIVGGSYENSLCQIGDLLSRMANFAAPDFRSQYLAGSQGAAVYCYYGITLLSKLTGKGGARDTGADETYLRFYSFQFNTSIYQNKNPSQLRTRG